MILEQAKEVLKIEADSILRLTRTIDSSFEDLVTRILNSSGRVIISGIGKSGLIGKKSPRPSSAQEPIRFFCTRSKPFTETLDW